MCYTIKLLIAGALLATLPGLSHAVADIQQWSTANGTRVYFMPSPELPMVDVWLSLDAGSARDGAKAGLAQLTGALLESGTASLSADAVAESLDGVGAQLEIEVLRDRTILSLRSLSESGFLLPALDVFNRIVREPVFSGEALERERGRLLTAIRQRAQSPRSIAEEAFYRTLYGEHPYASPPGGTESGLNAVSRADIVEFHRRYYAAANAVIAIVGAVDRVAAERIVNTVFAGVPSGEAAPVLPDVPPAPAKALVVRISHPSSQSHVLMGTTGINRTHPDYYSLYLGNHALGGDGLVSRLAEEIRQKRGLSYSVYSELEPLQQAGLFMMGLQTRNDQVPEAVAVLRSTLQAFVRNGPEPEELEAARDNISGGFALRIDSNSKLVRFLSLIGFYALPLDYLQTFTHRIEAQSLEQVHKALQKHIRPERLITVIVGGA